MIGLPPGVRRLFRFPCRSAAGIRDGVAEEIRFHLDTRAEELVRADGILNGRPPADLAGRLETRPDEIAARGGWKWTGWNGTIDK